MEDLFGEFQDLFERLTGRRPYPWQSQMYRDLMGEAAGWPKQVEAPTGAGKTSLMAVWLIALCQQARSGPGTKLPRRLVWVVNRRVVVDQATAIAEELAKRVAAIPEVAEGLRKLAGGLEGPLLAVSTLRGELADNREWSLNPARAAIVVGTVDMVGSRLLFSGYGDWLARRPHHAGLLGQDALIVNDEAHLSPAFAALLEQIPQYFKKRLRPWHAMRLSATQRENDRRYPGNFGRDCEESEEFRKRYEAVKRLEIIEVEDTRAQESRMMELALAGQDRRVVVFFREPGRAKKFAAALRKKEVRPEQIVLLTGTQRGYERDLLAGDEGGLTRFQQGGEERMWLVATSAGEVGIDVSGTRLITSLDTAEHLIQRFGRLNRFGESEAGEAYVVHTPLKAGRDEDLQRALEFLEKLAGDASARRLFEMEDPVPFPAEPLLAPLNGWQLGRWAFTSIEKGRGVIPDVEAYLHGQQDELSRTTLAWRWETAQLVSRVGLKQAKEAMRAHRLLAREKLEAPTKEVREYLRQLAERFGAGERVLVVDARGELSIGRLGELSEEKNEARLRYATVVLPVEQCFLEDGMLAEPSERASANADVADRGADGRRRFLLRQQEEGWVVLDREGNRVAEFRGSYVNWCRETGYRVKKYVRLEARVVEEEEEVKEEGLLYVTELTEQQRRREIELADHLRDVGAVAARMAEAVGLSELASEMESAGRQHDLGKKCAQWKAAMGIAAERDLAKTAWLGNPRDLGGYRHELGSLLRAEGLSEMGQHLVAVHHGRGRAFFEPKAFEPGAEGACREAGQAQARRFAALQREYGYYELAYMETLLRGADWLVSAREGGEQIDHE